jgi:Flp pilus assembly protein TadB
LLGGAALVAMGVRLPVWLVPLGCVAVAVAGWVLPDLALRDQAELQRRAFRHALSAYLDLVNILLAGGAGIETALYAAADVGEGWGFERLRHALDRARLTGQSPWDSFARLGESLDVTELSELAASVSLAGSHGARIRSSLAAKADALRGHQVAEAEAAAEAATERMTIPVTVMLAGFLVFIAFPALLEVTSVS